MMPFKKIFSERNVVILLFCIALISFSLAQENSRQFTKQHAAPSATTEHEQELLTEELPD